MTYLLVRFRLFNIKTLGAQMLVVVLWGTVFMLFFLRSIESVRIVVVLALVFVTILGFYLIRGVRREIAQREQIEALALNLEKANERLTELDKMKSQFLSIASHDLRAPLTVIRNFMSLLLDGTYGKLPSAAAEGAQQVFDRATEMAKSVDNYLNVSRIEQGKMKYDLVDVDLAKIVSDTVGIFKPTAEQKGLKLVYQDPGSRIQVKADIGKLQEVFNNLIDNSIKYTPTGSITVTLEKAGAMARVIIKDTGLGMSKETITNKLFKLFSTDESSKKVNPSSTGVGLYVVKAIIEAHHGTIRAESPGEGHGSTFIVELPTT